MTMKNQIKSAIAARKAASSKAPDRAPASKPQGENRATREARERAEKLEQQLAFQHAKLQQLESQANARQTAEVVQRRLDFAKRAGARVGDDVLSRVLPDVDPRTPEGAQALEQFRMQNAALFAPEKPKAADVTSKVREQIEAKANGQRQPLSQRKIFGAEFVQRTLDRNLGGGDA
jgi:hypothetical protein